MSDDDAWQAKLNAAAAALERIARGAAPTPEELAFAPRLDFWRICAHDGFLLLHGFVTGHPKFSDGTRIVTSSVLWVSDDRRAARTLSRFYRLGVRFDEFMSSAQ